MIYIGFWVYLMNTLLQPTPPSLSNRLPPAEFCNVCPEGNSGDWKWPWWQCFLHVSWKDSFSSLAFVSLISPPEMLPPGWLFLPLWILQDQLKSFLLPEILLTLHTRQWLPPLMNTWATRCRCYLNFWMDIFLHIVNNFFLIYLLIVLLER